MLAELISGFETIAAVQHLVNTHASTRPTESHGGADRENALVFAAQKLKNPCFKPEQGRVVKAYMIGRDAFVSLPTGFGTSACCSSLHAYQLTVTAGEPCFSD